jgi:hypothetical protein
MQRVYQKSEKNEVAGRQGDQLQFQNDNWIRPILFCEILGNALAFCKNLEGVRRI